MAAIACAAHEFAPFKIKFDAKFVPGSGILAP